MSISVTQRSLRRASRPAAKKPIPLNQRRTRAALLFLLPGLALFSVFVIYPIISSIWLSFHHWDGMTAGLGCAGRSRVHVRLERLLLGAMPHAGR